MIRKIEVVTHNGPVKEAPKNFEINFFFRFRKPPVTLWLKSDFEMAEIVSALLNFTNDILFMKNSN